MFHEATPMEFDLSFLDQQSRDALQNAIDGVNKACIDDPGAWNYVSAGNLIQASEDRGVKPLDEVAICIFTEMKKMNHSGFTAEWTIAAITSVAKNFRNWRHEVIISSLIHMKEDIDCYIKMAYQEKFADEPEESWDVQKNKVLHSLEYSYLASYILSEDGRNVLKYLLKMDDVSYLGNDVILDEIEEYLRIL